MSEPISSRPDMKDYGIKPADEGTGLLPWSWAEDRLLASHDYWVATVWPDARPHVTPVWGAWIDGALWFSCGPNSRKARNLTANPHCTATTDNPQEPVIVNGVAQPAPGRDNAQAFTDACNGKYEYQNTVEFFEANALFRIPPDVVIGLMESDFNGSPTRWLFNRP